MALNIILNRRVTKYKSKSVDKVKDVCRKLTIFKYNSHIVLQKVEYVAAQVVCSQYCCCGYIPQQVICSQDCRPDNILHQVTTFYKGLNVKKLGAS